MNIKSTYFHSMTVLRIQDIENEWGSTKQEYTPVESLMLIPCAFSQSSRNSKNTKRTESENVIKYNPKIFCDPELNILAGDRIEIVFNTRKIGEFTTSEPYFYSTHQEITLELLGDA